MSGNLKACAGNHTQVLTDNLIQNCKLNALWSEYGIDNYTVVSETIALFNEIVLPT